MLTFVGCSSAITISIARWTPLATDQNDLDDAADHLGEHVILGHADESKAQDRPADESSISDEEEDSDNTQTFWYTKRSDNDASPTKSMLEQNIKNFQSVSGFDIAFLERFF